MPQRPGSPGAWSTYPEVNMGKSKPPVSLLWEKYSFNPLTSRFHSIHGSPRKLPDEAIQGNIVAGSKGGLTSHQLSINGEHRYPYGVCVFAWLHGRWPEDGIHIDHINHNPFDHRPFNLQELPASENSRRRRAHGRAGSKRDLLPGRRHSTRKKRKLQPVGDDWTLYLEFLASAIQHRTR